MDNENGRISQSDHHPSRRSRLAARGLAPRPLTESVNGYFWYSDIRLDYSPRTARDDAPNPGSWLTV